MNKTVLIVDDLENTRFIVKFTLQQKKYNILEATNGEEALVLLDSNKVDLVITDLNMPIMNGIELTMQIKAKSEYRSIPVLMLTTEVSEEKRLTAQKEGVTWWIKKPFDVKQLLKIVEKAL